MSNVKPLWLVCDSMSLPFYVNGLSSESFRLIHLGSHFPTTQVISPLSSLESQHLCGPFHIFFFLEKLCSSIAPFLVALFFVIAFLTTPSISTLVALFIIPHVAPFVTFTIHSFVVPFNLPSDVTPLFPTYAYPSLSGNNLHVDSPTSLEKVIDWNDIPDTYLNPNLVPCPLVEKIKKSYDRT
jgi:hypothetical protein